MKYCYLFALFLSSCLAGYCFQVSIVANPLLPSNRYSRNTPLTLSCEVQGAYYGSLSYNWTTAYFNPPRSFIAGRTSSIVTTTSLNSNDYGPHTCTVHDESGRNGSAVFTSFLSGGSNAVLSIVAEYTPPHSSSSLRPPSYYSNTALSLFCKKYGMTLNGLGYEWTSTCSGDCFSKGATTSLVSTTSLQLKDSGVHTCTVTDRNGRKYSTSINISVIASHFRTGPQVSIVSRYSQPRLPIFKPPSYYSNVYLFLSCQMHDVSSNGPMYNWTSTCSGSCFAKGKTANNVSTDSLQARDSGVHTCTVCDNGHCGSSNVTINVKEPEVSVRVHYTPPDQYPDYSPPNYRVASSVRITCETPNALPGPYKICWTHPYLPSNGLSKHCHSNHASVSIPQLEGSHAGTFTCNFTDSLGRTGNDSIQINVVGSGIYLSTFIDGHSSGNNPNNTYAVVNTGRSYNTTRLSFYCCSNITYFTYYHSPYVHLKTPSGTIIRSTYSYPNIHFRDYAYRGCLHAYITQRRHSRYDLESGIYTCRVLDAQRAYELMIGLYPATFEGYPYVYNIYTVPSDQILTIICQTRDAPPTNLYWYLNDTLINIDRNVFTVSQRVTNYTSSSYDNMLLVDYKQGNAVGTYHCNVSNHYGTSKSSVISIQDFSIFQLKLRPIDDNLLNGDDLERSIQDRLVKEINWRCKCGFKNSNIISGEFRHQISTHSIIYRAKVHITNGNRTTVDQVMGHIQDWRKDQGTLLYHSFRLTVANEIECPLRIMSFDEKQCV